MSLEPRPDGRGVAVRQEIDDVVGLEVDDDGAVALSFAPGPVVDADEFRGTGGSSAGLLDATQQRIGAGRHGGLPRQSGSGFTTQGRADGEVSLGETHGRASMFGGEAIERLGEDAARASRPRAEESPDRHLETDTMTENRFLGEMASRSGYAPAKSRGRRRDRMRSGFVVAIPRVRVSSSKSVRIRRLPIGVRRSWDRSNECLQKR